MLDITLDFAPVEAPALVTGYRCKHKNEPGAPDNPTDGMPEVRPSNWGNGIDFGYRLQQLSWELMQWGNSTITPKQWRAVYKHDVAFTNYQGFDKPGDPRADFINGQDVGAELPKLMKVTICGGSLYQGLISDSIFTLVPGVHGIDATKPIPDMSTVVNNGWYFSAVTWHSGNKIADFPQGNGGRVLIPLVLSVPVSYPLAWFQKWEADAPPDPLRYYL